MSCLPILMVAALTSVATADQSNPMETMIVDGQPVTSLSCQLQEGEALVADAIEHSLEGRKAELAACSEAGETVTLQWSWAGDKGATIVVTHPAESAVADCVEAALEARAEPIEGTCTAHLPVGPSSAVVNGD